MRLLRSRFLQAVLILVLAFVILRFGIRPPAPWSVLTLYLAIIFMAVMVFVSSDRDSWRSFIGPIWTTLVRPERRPLRIALVIVIPLLVGCAGSLPPDAQVPNITKKPLEEILFQGNIHRSLGTDISLGARYRPFLSNNWIISGGVAGFLPGRGFKDIYEDTGTLYHLFTNVTLQF